MFRNILAGALLGGAAAKGTNSVLTGFARGGSAGIEMNQAENARRRNQAQQQFQNQQAAQRSQEETQRAADEHLKSKAQLEAYSQQQILADHDANLRDMEFWEKHNNATEQMNQWATEAGAIQAPVPHNGEIGNGAFLMKDYADHPEKYAAPEGWVRFFNHTVDTQGLRFDNKTHGYVDENGDPVDLKDRTTWNVMYVPSNAAKEIISVKGSVLKKLYPDMKDLLADEKDYNVPLMNLFGLSEKTHSTNLQNARDDYRARHDEIQRQLSVMKDRADNLGRQIDTLSRISFPDEDTKKQIADLTAQRQKVYDDYDQLQAQTHPNSKLRKVDSGRNKAATAQKNPPQGTVPKGMVQVQTTDGQVGNIPADQLDAFLKKNPGAKTLTSGAAK